jgi:hypothetical protein
MSLVSTGLLSGLASLTRPFRSLHIPPCLIIGGKIYGGITLFTFIIMVVTKEKSTSNKLYDQLQEYGAVFCLSLIWPVFLYWMFDDDEDAQWRAYEAHRKQYKN